jgi:hypothetical protein
MIKEKPDISQKTAKLAEKKGKSSWVESILRKLKKLIYS